MFTMKAKTVCVPAFRSFGVCPTMRRPTLGAVGIIQYCTVRLYSGESKIKGTIVKLMNEDLEQRRKSQRKAAEFDLSGRNERTSGRGGSRKSVDGGWSWWRL